MPLCNRMQNSFKVHLLLGVFEGRFHLERACASDIPAAKGPIPPSDQRPFTNTARSPTAVGGGPALPAWPCPARPNPAIHQKQNPLHRKKIHDRPPTGKQIPCHWRPTGQQIIPLEKKTSTPGKTPSPPENKSSPLKGPYCALQGHKMPFRAL